MLNRSTIFLQDKEKFLNVWTKLGHDTCHAIEGYDAKGNLQKITTVICSQCCNRNCEPPSVPIYMHKDHRMGKECFSLEFIKFKRKFGDFRSARGGCFLQKLIVIGILEHFWLGLMKYVKLLLFVVS